ncbi:MAG TPA: hypothetical protein VNF47_01820 [Streptosporangiaceae bacterium]|nr:hypothetical protein [Streptosporangiaceae bacterium]
MNDDHSLHCPECGEAAVRQPPVDLIPWETHDTLRPEWSHQDGSSLCPVIGPSDGYQPAQPQPAQSEPGRQAEPARPSGSPAGQVLATNAIAALGRERSIRILAHLGDLHRQALRADPEPEAGA